MRDLQQALRSVNVLVIGDVMLDRYWFGDVSRISPEAPVPIVRVTRHDERLGGAANVACNVVALGARSTLIGVIGADEPGRCIESMAIKAGINTQLQRDDILPTTIKLRVIGRQQQLLRVDFEQSPSVEALTDKLQRVEESLIGADIVVLSDYGKGSLAMIESIITKARSTGKRLIVDPKGDDYQRYRGATILTPNRAELREVVGSWHNEEDLRVRTQKLRESLEIEALLLTRSEEGMSLFTSQGVFDVPARAREVYDVSGAGDTVVAVMAVMLAAGQQPLEAVEWANKAGGIVVGKLGTATVTVEELFGSDLSMAQAKQ